MYRNGIIPFYVAYPNYQMYSDEYRRMQDLEYLQAMYPAEVKVYQKKINQVLDRLDYAGSMIYDEYPDQLMMRMKCREICKEVQTEEDAEDLGAKIEALYPKCDVELQFGGQPIYYYIVSAE